MPSIIEDTNNSKRERLRRLSRQAIRSNHEKWRPLFSFMFGSLSGFFDTPLLVKYQLKTTKHSNKQHKKIEIHILSICFCTRGRVSQKVSREMTFDKKDFNNSEFRSLYMDDKNVLWMLNIVHGVFEYDTRSKKMVKYPLPLKINYAVILNTYENTDANGNIWFHINTGNDPYVCFEKDTHRYSIHFADDPPRAIFSIKIIKVLAYNDRLVCYDADAHRNVTVPKVLNGKPFSFSSRAGIPDSYGRLWMTVSGGGLCYYDGKQNRFYQYRHDNLKLKTLPFDLTTSLFIDRDDNLWIGSDGGGKKLKITVDANTRTVSSDYKGFLPGLRAGLSIGFRF